MALPRDDTLSREAPNPASRARPARGIREEKRVEGGSPPEHGLGEHTGGLGEIGAAPAGHDHPPKHNREATAAPGVNDDVLDGYGVGSEWDDVTNDKAYVLLDATAGAAVWIETTAGAAGGYTTVEDEGVPLAQRTTIDFQGAGVTAADVGGETRVTIPGGGAQDAPLLDGAEHNDTAAAGPARGDVIAADATPEWAALSPYEAGEYLRYDGADTYWGLLHDHLHAGVAGDGGTISHGVLGDINDDDHHDPVTAADGGHAVMAQALASQPATTALSAHVELATVAEANAGTDTGRACTPDSIGSPTRTIVLTAAGGAPSTTTPCSDPTKVEAGTNDVDYWVLDFDASSDEYAFWGPIPMPENYDGGTMTAKFYWTTTATDTDGVAWAIQLLSLDDNDAIDTAWGAAVVTTDDAQGAAGEMLITAVSGAITPGGTAAAPEVLCVRVYRDVSDANDDMAEDARLIAVKLEYNCEGYSD